MRYWKEMGEATYKGLLEADKGGDTVDARGIWYKAKAKTGGRAWATTDGRKVYVETDKGLMMGLALWREYRD